MPQVTFLKRLSGNWLILGHLLAILLFAAVTLVQKPMASEDGSSGFGRYFPIFFIGLSMSRPCTVGLWCALSPGCALRRFNRALVLLLSSWVLWLVMFASHQHLVLEMPLSAGLVEIALFMPAFLAAWVFRLSFRWLLVKQGMEPMITSQQFTTRDLFHLLTLVAMALGLFVSLPLLFRTRALGWEGTGYAMLDLLAVLVNFVLVPVLVLGSWGLLAESQRRFWITAAVLGGLFAIACLGEFALLLVADSSQVDQLFVFGFLGSGIYLSLLATAFVLRIAGYRMIRAVSQNKET